MRSLLTLGFGVVLVGCSFDGHAGIDADPTRPDADPNRPDADLTRPDARQHPDANPLLPDGPPVPDAPPGTPDASPPPDAMVAMCPAGYASIAGLANASKYRIVNTSTTWGAAEADCEDDAGALDIPSHLAVIDNTTERDAIAIGSDQWVGYTDLQLESNPYIYVTPQATTFTSSPSGDSAMKDCTKMMVGGGYQARDCNNTVPYTCECDGFTADPARFPNLPDGN